MGPLGVGAPRRPAVHDQDLRARRNQHGVDHVRAWWRGPAVPDPLALRLARGGQRVVAARVGARMLGRLPGLQPADPFVLAIDRRWLPVRLLPVHGRAAARPRQPGPYLPGPVSRVPGDPSDRGLARSADLRRADDAFADGAIPVLDR